MSASRLRAHGLESGREVAEEDKEERAERPAPSAKVVKLPASWVSVSAGATARGAGDRSGAGGNGRGAPAPTCVRRTSWCADFARTVTRTVHDVDDRDGVHERLLEGRAHADQRGRGARGRRRCRHASGAEVGRAVPWRVVSGGRAADRRRERSRRDCDRRYYRWYRGRGQCGRGQRRRRRRHSRLLRRSLGKNLRRRLRRRRDTGRERGRLRACCLRDGARVAGLAIRTAMLMLQPTQTVVPVTSPAGGASSGQFQCQFQTIVTAPAVGSGVGGGSGVVGTPSQFQYQFQISVWEGAGVGAVGD